MKNFIVLILMLLSLGWREAYGQNTYYMKLDGIQGEVTAEGYKDWVAVSSFMLGMGVPTASGNAPHAPLPKLDDVVIVKSVDLASTGLNQRCIKGDQQRTVTLVCVRSADVHAGTFVHYRVTLGDVVIKSVRVKGDASAMVEEVSFAPARIKWEYWPLRPDGSPGPGVSAEWDIGHGAPK